MITTKFNTYQFYTEGYLLGITPRHIYDKAHAIIKDTAWNDGYPQAADWFVLPNVVDGDNNAEYNFTEVFRERYTYDSAPLAVKFLAEEFIRDPFFDVLRNSLVKQQHQHERYMRNLTPNGYGLWNGQEDLPWHTDNNTSSDFFVLMYFGDTESWNEQWKGQIQFGKEREDGSIEQLCEHFPHDGTFAVVDARNPLFRHRTFGCDPAHNRYALSFRYRLI